MNKATARRLARAAAPGPGTAEGGMPDETAGPLLDAREIVARLRRPNQAAGNDGAAAQPLPFDGDGRDWPQPETGQADGGIGDGANASGGAEFLKALPPELKGRFAARERERERVIEARTRQAALALRELARLQAWASDRLERIIGDAGQAIHGDFASVDWNRLRGTDPARFLTLNEAFKHRLAGLERARQARQVLEQHAGRRREAEHAATSRSELQRVLPAVRALIGDMSGKELARHMAKFLETEGVPREAAERMDQGWQLVVATKALLFDRLMADKAKAAEKIASAPKVMRPGAKASDEDSGPKAGLTRARSALRLNPNDVSAMAAALRAKRQG